MNITILLFDDVDLLDSGGPYEVFLTASRLAERDGQPPPFSVTTATPDGKAVIAYGGLGLQPTADVADAREPGVLIVPGTIDIDAAMADQALIDSIADAAERVLAHETSVVASVCTGAFLLGSAGLLDNRAWTTHWEDIDQLAVSLGSQDAIRGVRWVDTGQIVTAAGLRSGIDMALHLVHRFAGDDLAIRTARQIDHVWDRNGVHRPPG